jgi:hypothetical protein
LPGELTAAPRFQGSGAITAPDQLKPASGSPLLRTGDPLHANRDGSRRDIGAYIDNPSPATGWMMIATP